MSTYGFIGTGNMAAALLAAAAAGGFGPDCILYNRTPAKARALAARYGCTVAESANQAAAQADILFLGVKPHQMGSVLEELRPTLAGRGDGGPVLVSMAAGVSLARLKELAGLDLPVVRIMPNTPCAIGKGIVFVTPAADVEPGQVARVKALLAAAGSLLDLDESLMDAGGVIAGCTPAWAYLFIEGLADGAVAAGMPRAQALACAAGAVEGAAALVRESGKHPGQLKDEVCSPGGSTIAGVRALERHGVRGAAMDAVLAACERTAEMSGTGK